MGHDISVLNCQMVDPCSSHFPKAGAWRAELYGEKGGKGETANHLALFDGVINHCENGPLFTLERERERGDKIDEKFKGLV